MTTVYQHQGHLDNAPVTFTVNPDGTPTEEKVLGEAVISLWTNEIPDISFGAQVVLGEEQEVRAQRIARTTKGCETTYMGAAKMQDVIVRANQVCLYGWGWCCCRMLG